MSEPTEAVWTDVGDALIVPPSFIVEGLLPEGLTLLTGPPKNYKSAVELGIILSACGIANNILPADLSLCHEPGRVMILSAEAEAGVLRHTAEKGAGVKIPNDMRFLAMSDPWKFRLDNPMDMRSLLDWADELDPLVLCIDPLRNFHSLDENDAGGMVQMLQPFQQWCVANRKSGIIVHHSKKLGEDKDSGKQRNATANDMRGTSALFGMADCVLSCTAKGKGLIHLSSVSKRAEAWERTIQLGLWGQTSNESIDATTKMVFELLKTGLAEPKVASAMKLTKTQLTEHVLLLKRLGALTSAGLPTEKGAELVTAAVRKFVPQAR